MTGVAEQICFGHNTEHNSCYTLHFTNPLHACYFITQNTCRCAGLSGVYDITDHYEHEKVRGVEYISTMHKAMDGVENFEYYSPTARIRKLNKDQLERYKTNLFN